MTQFATVEDLGVRLGTVIPNDKQAQATQYLEAATAAIQREARQRLELVVADAVDLRATPTRPELRLPERPVLEVTELLVDSQPATQLVWTRWGRLRWGPIPPDDDPAWPFVIPATIRVTYTHGYALTEADIPSPNPLGITVLPDELRFVCIEAAVRAFGGPVGTYDPPPGGGGVQLTDEEKRAARRFR